MIPAAHAWHEAGHALAAHLMGGVVREVSIESELDGAGGHTRVEWPAGPRPDHPRRLAAVALAGAVAERLAGGAEVLDDAASVAAWRPDWTQARRELARLHADPDTRQRAERQLLAELDELFEEPTTYEALARVADALDAHGTLDDELFQDALAQG